MAIRKVPTTSPAWLYPAAGARATNRHPERRRSPGATAPPADGPRQAARSPTPDAPALRPDAAPPLSPVAPRLPPPAPADRGRRRSRLPGLRRAASLDSAASPPETQSRPLPSAPVLQEKER